MANINLIKHCLTKLQNTAALRRGERNYEVDESSVFEIRDGVLLFTNFSGNANHWGNSSKNFNLVLPPNLVDLFASKDFSVRGKHLNVRIHQYPSEDEVKAIKDSTGEDVPVLYYINVKINMDSEYPPVVKLFTEKIKQKDDGSIVTERGQSSLDDVTIATLDSANLDKVDCVISLRESKASAGYAVCYLNQLYAKQVVTPAFGGDWEDFDEPIDVNPEILAANKDVMK